MNNDRYAIYLRKSRADLDLEALGQGETLARHRTMLYDLAERHDILPEQITEFKEVVSGESIASRPQMQKLLSEVYQKKYKGVLVVEVERLARGNTKDQGEVADAFQYSNTLIITPLKIYNPQNQYDQEYFEFGLFMSRREYKTIRRRMEAGIHQSFSEGNYVGSVRPYGYDIKRINKKERILTINPEEAPIVKMIFDWFTEDRKTVGWIARELTRMHIPTMQGNSEWHRGTIMDILKNVHYTGKVRWNCRKMSKEYDAESNTLVKHKRRLTPDAYDEAQGKHEAIISEEQFQKAQSLFTGTVPVHVEGTVINPLAGILVCASCGKTFQLQEYGQREHTASRIIHGTSQQCKKKSVPLTEVMSALTDALKEYIDDFEVKLEQQNNLHMMSKHAETLEALEAELKKQEKRKTRLFDLYEDGSYTKEEFISRKQSYNETIEDLKNQIAELKEQEPQEINYEEKIVSLHQVIDMLNDEAVSAKEKNIFLKSIISRIEFDTIDQGWGKGATPVLDVYLK